MKNPMKNLWLHQAALAAALGLFSSFAAAAELQISGDGLLFSPDASAPAYPGYQLRVVAPDGSVYEDFFVADEPMWAPGALGSAADGTYRYEITPVVDMQVRAEAWADGAGPSMSAAVGETGSFRIDGGNIVASDMTEQSVVGTASDVPKSAMGVEPQDQTIPDDLIVIGSLCVGFDCVTNEVFSFDTIRMKENNTRIKFEDTSTLGGFPSNDWQLTANDSASGGLNKFSIDDVTGGRTPFTVVAGAPTNSVFIDSTGRVGFRTNTPVLDLHINGSNTPALRMEQNGSAGWSPHTWDVAANETNFFVRDVTSGSRLPFRIRPGAPTSSIDIAASGNVGIGTASPGAALDIARTGDVVVRVRNISPAQQWDIKNNSATGRLTFSDDPAGTRVPFKFAPNAVDNLLRVGVLANNTVDINGNLMVTGTITPDYVFEKGFELPSIKQHAELMWSRGHLPKVARAQVNEQGKGVINVGERSQGVLEEVEYAHIYIEQLHDTMTGLQQDLAKKDVELAQLRDEIATIKAALRKD